MNHFTGVLRSLHMRPSMVSLNSLDKFNVQFNTQTIWAPYNTVPNNWTMTLDGSPGIAVTPETKVRYLSFPLSGTHHVI